MADAIDGSILTVDTKAVLKLIRDLEVQLSEYHRCVGSSLFVDELHRTNQRRPQRARHGCLMFASPCRVSEVERLFCALGDCGVWGDMLGLVGVLGVGEGQGSAQRQTLLIRTNQLRSLHSSLSCALGDGGVWGDMLGLVGRAQIPRPRCGEGPGFCAERQTPLY